MINLAFGVFLVVHGAVHLWYVVLSQGWIEVEDQMGWNGHSWLLSGILPEGTILTVASLMYVLVAVGFVAGGIGYALEEDWSIALLLGTAVLSTLVLVVMWDGKMDLLVEKGLLGVVLNLAIAAYLLVR